MYIIGGWFSKLWHVAKNRSTGTDAFQTLFETLVLKHHQHISFYQTHTSQVFLDIIASQYFGTHISLSKL